MIQCTDDAVERAARIKMLMMDVDGTLTDGTVFYNSRGDEIEGFSVRDGLGIRLAQKAGLKTAFLTGRSSKAVCTRAKELEITRVILGRRKKREALEETLQELSLRADEVAYVGDDINDIPVLRSVGLAVGVADAAAEVLAVAHARTENPGGRGAVREVIEFILRSQNRWEAAARILTEDE
jgi:3-deoxy-D-manno-octulosonate 8-phosphate phosphatase (KDO 8-P phosphatase)